MRILAVEMKGFGPFKDSQTVDFTAFEDSGIFLIGGRTGAGKSTILDAICFALYGGVPRYQDYTGAVSLRSDHCEIDDTTQVTLTFEANDETYRIVRNPDYHRPKSRGTGVTTQPAGAELSIRTADDWEVIETKIPEVAKRVPEIVKLNQKQFLQVILLAQNRFQEFLEAESKDRQTLLRTLFGTRRFEEYAEALQARALDLGGELRMLTADATRTVGEIASVLEVEPPVEDDDRLAWAVDRLAAALDALTAAQGAEAEAVKRAQVASAALRAAEQLNDRQRRRATAEQRLTELAARADVHTQNRQRLDAAVRAAEVQQLVDAVDSAQGTLAAARARQAAAHEAAGTVPDSDLSEFVQAIVHTLGSLTQALEAESTLPELVRADTDARAALNDHESSAATIATRRASLRARLSELADGEVRATAAAKDLPVVEALIASSLAARAAAARLAEMTVEIGLLQSAELAASRARTGASSSVDRLLELQLHGRAASLAQTLADDQPCPVCGALEHPHPAAFDAEPITEQQVAEARSALEQATSAAADASSSLADARARAAEQRGAAGGRDVAELDAELDAARARLRTAQAAQTTLEQITAERVRIVAGQERLAEEERTADERREALAQTVTLAAKRLGDAKALTELARQSHPSVAARARSLRTHQAALERLIGARTQAASAQAASDAAASAMESRLEQSGFADRRAAEDAMLPELARAELSRSIRDHEDGLMQSRAVLDQPDLQNLPREPADVAAARERASEADTARSVSTEQRARLAERVQRGRELAAKLESDLEDSVELEAEFKLVDGLAGTMRGVPPNELGIPLESFVLAAELEEIVAAANGRLQKMSQGRYTIEHSDDPVRRRKRAGLEIVVYDAHTGAARTPQSLSGGEKFLASLALALGLAEVVTNRAGGIQLDTLFIDEGFGALDDETLEFAMQTLDELRQGGRTVGLISHVEAMKDQIPAKLLVEVTDGGWSVVRQNL